MNALPTTQEKQADLSEPVLKRTMTGTELVAALRSRLDELGLSRIRRNDRSMALRRLEAFLRSRQTKHVNPDENLLNEFEDWMVGGDESSRRYHAKTTSHLRSLVNSLPDSLLRRKLLTNREVRRLNRFEEFAPETAEMIRRFLADGRKTRGTTDGPVLTTDLLSPAVRRSAVYAAARLLRETGVKDVRSLAQDHVDAYLASYGEEGRQTAVHGLSDAHPLFKHLVASGELDEDPLSRVGRKAKTSDDDYVPADQVAKLADLATLDCGCFRDVRDRLIAYTLCYDFGLRVGEAVRLRTSDVRMNSFVEVALRGEVQKGSEKPSVTLRNLFGESRRLFELYLELRGEMSSEAGGPLLVTGCRRAVKRVSESLGIRTHGGKVPPPHRYRHSLGTLNVGELGMRLSPYYLMRRYRHGDVRTTMETYVAKNPLLDEAQHMAVVAASGNGHAEANPEPRSTAADITVPENEAMARVRSLGIAWRSLRRYVLDEGAAVERSNRVFYSESFLDALCTEWMTKAEAMRLMDLKSSSGYFHRLRSEGLRTLVVGRASLVRTDDVIRALRSDGNGGK